LTAGYIPYAVSSSSIADSPLYYDTTNAYLYSEFSTNIIGLGLKYNNNEYYLGDFNAVSNGTYIGVFDNTAFQSIILSGILLDFPKAGILDATSRSYTNRNLICEVNGTAYYIPLYT
jgi:hypothetical protein